MAPQRLLPRTSVKNRRGLTSLNRSKGIRTEGNEGNEEGKKSKRTHSPTNAAADLRFLCYLLFKKTDAADAPGSLGSNEE
jgi:hypothetical protein